MRDIVKGIIAWVIIIIAACIAETITVNAQEYHSTMWEEANGQPIITSMYTGEAEEDLGYTQEELELIARCVQAEYGNGTELDKRMVVAVILNRLESDFPDFAWMDTVKKVVCAPDQFAIADYYTLETMNAVYKEIQERTDYRVLWFSSAGYLPYGEPIIQVGAHCFSGFMA